MDVVLRVHDDQSVDLNDVRIVQKVGGVLEDLELIDGIVFEHKLLRSSATPRILQNCNDPIPALSTENRHGITDCS